MSDWLKTSKGEDRGYIEAKRLKELWFHTGTRCNLSCPFCLEGSSPTADRLNYISLEDALPYMKEAVELGVEKFSFTGGEPFLNKAMLPILKAALQLKPCLVLTNGTKPILQKMEELESLKSLSYPLHFRVSIDFADQEQHDAGRGKGSFGLAIECIRQLQERGFKVSLARQADLKEDKAQVDQTFKNLLRANQIDEESIHIVAFPDFLTPGARAEVPEITTNCMTTYQSEETRNAFMCSFSRMVIKREGSLQVSACTLVDDDPSYDLSISLKDSLESKVMMKHHRCFSCFSFGASCSEA